MIANLEFIENVDPDQSVRIPLTVHATGAELLGISHGQLQFGEPGRRRETIALPNDIAGLTGDRQWKHGRTSIPQGTPIPS